MRFATAIAVAVAVTAIAVRDAAAQESLDDIDKGKAASSPTEEVGKSVRAEVNGYIDNRFQYTAVAPNRAPVSTRDLPTLQDILETNVQLKVNFGARAFAYADVSLLFQAGGLYFESDGMGGQRQAADHYNASLLPFVAPSELYLTWSPKPWLNLMAGRKRIVWGSGFAFNPTDLINPLKDPTDPNSQRAGAWLARVELPFQRFTVSLLGVPSVLYQANGLPWSMLKYPAQGPPGDTSRDDAFHYLLAARLYALILNSDINLTYFFTNQFQNGFKNKSRFGVSFSRYFFTDYELHVEALFQTGSARSFVNHDCLLQPGGAACPDPINQALAPSRLDSTSFYPRVLVGGRTVFRDESSLSIEYYYQSDGYSDAEFSDLVQVIAAANAFGAMVPGTSGTPSSGALPNRFTFDPLRRHYLIVSYNKPKIFDDWTAGLTTIVGLTDLSGVLTPTVSWSAREWLSLTLLGLIPIRDIPVGQVAVNGRNYSEYSLAPFDARILFEVRAFY